MRLLLIIFCVIYNNIANAQKGFYNVVATEFSIDLDTWIEQENLLKHIEVTEQFVVLHFNDSPLPIPRSEFVKSANQDIGYSLSYKSESMFLYLTYVHFPYHTSDPTLGMAVFNWDALDEGKTKIFLKFVVIEGM